MMLDLSSISARLDNDGPFAWLHPCNISGYELKEALAASKKKWFSLVTIDEDDAEPIDELITDYLHSCLVEEKLFKRETITDIDLVEAILWLMSNLGSSYAANILSSWRSMVWNENFSPLLEVSVATYESASDLFIKDIVREFIIDFFTIDYEVASCVNEDVKAKVHQILNTGCLTK